jgi:hypothetical protein
MPRVSFDTFAANAQLLAAGRMRLERHNLQVKGQLNSTPIIANTYAKRKSNFSK